MSIDEAIAHAKEVATIQRNNEKLNRTLRTASPYVNENCLKCAEEHEQLSEWLEELKKYKEKPEGYLWDEAVQQGYNKAIDDFVKEICKMIVQSENNGNYRFYAVEIKQAIAELAEQLKAGISNET